MERWERAHSRTRSRRSPDERPVPAATDPGRARFARCPRGRRRSAALMDSGPRSSRRFGPDPGHAGAPASAQMIAARAVAGATGLGSSVSRWP